MRGQTLGSGYIIEDDTKAHGGQTITCLTCGRKSYHPDDVKNLYCGNCNGTHDRAAAARVATGTDVVYAKGKLTLHRAAKAPWLHGPVEHRTQEGVVYVGCSCGTRFWPPGS